jgi:Ca-activated chloride channel family protein
MFRHSALKWATLTALCCAVVLILAAYTHFDSASAAAVRPKPNAGSLQGLSEGKPVGECPLKHTTVRAEVSGSLSRVTVTQDFENPFTKKIEAVYQFPLPQAAAVDDMTMLIGERTIKGKIMRREDAKNAYETAKKLGQVASLLDQERPNIFTQSVANIMPGQQIRITISYVETLKYEDGIYEWSFPMVVAPRYQPASPTDESQNQPPTEEEPITSIPTDVQEETRDGHDISLEITLDPGVSIESVKSETHETEVDNANPGRTIVRLRDQVTIPNKDFVLKYQVAGSTIEDAVLTHRSDNGGFFTLILQPPQRINAEDVMPKELVFVLDTSGSMMGFPLDKAKETMQLALDNLYPHDTFNVITFSGDTHVLFSQPVPATPENLKQAKDFLASRQSNGGTEMMKAIKAALKPSDSQQHLRITCFMTDGQVGDDLAIIGEVQKYSNARVFAMGFGGSPNRFLLDKMAEYGRGEVEYVPENGDTSAVARRFNERIRNPLLTDISIDWSGLPVTDIYPSHIPDLFGAKPLILSGRYDKAGSGTIRLKGKMAGQDFTREIPVQLPESEPGHDVLATLWARRRIDDLMGEDMTGLQYGQMKEKPREEITQLGLNFRLMTQFTSFVAIDNVIFTPGPEPVRVNVAPYSVPPGTINYAVSETVTVSADTSNINVSADTFTTMTVVCTLQELPIQGRSYSSFALMTPGVASSNSNLSNSSVNGQRPSSNSFMIDGVSANFGIAAGGQDPGPSATGTTPALTASGGANGLTTLGATSEVTIRTNSVEAQYGRSTGAQISVVTRAGTNAFHGSLFHFFGNNALDANDWFATSRGLNEPARRLNNFGGTFDGPIKKNKVFFFGSYEGLRLRQPMTAITDVPSLNARQTAPAAISPFLQAFPLPTGQKRTDNFAEFASSFANPARHDVGSFRLDDNSDSITSVSLRYSFADSEAAQRGAGGFSLNTTNKITSRAQTFTGSLTRILSPNHALEFRGNYSRLRVTGSYLVDDFGGAGPLPNQVPQDGSFLFDLNGRNARLMTGSSATNVQRQLNLVGLSSIVSGSHTFKFGVDYRRLSPIIGLRALEDGVLFNGANQTLTGIATRISAFAHTTPQQPVFNNLSLYAQDDWRQSTRLTLSYGLRWEVNPAPGVAGGEAPFAVDQVNDVSQMRLAPRGTPLWSTTYRNFAPRLSFAYQLSQATDRELVLRGGVGILYDLGQESAGEAFADSLPFIAGGSTFNSSFPGPAGVSTGDLPLVVFDPKLTLPYVIRWNLSLQRALGSHQAVTASYFGSTGNRLQQTRTLFDQNPEFGFLRLTTNAASSDYRSLQLEFERRFSRNFSAFVSYNWSQSLDDASQDSVRNVLLTSSDGRLDRGPSDFDIRHLLSGRASYEVPAPFKSGIGNSLLRHWNLDSIFTARSARPVNVVYSVPTTVGFAYLRPDLLAGAPFYIFDSNEAGGRRINPGAFATPGSLQPGTLGRNSLRGFPLYQLDLALRRKFSFTESFALQLQADAFNLFNHPNFEDPIGSDLSLGTRLDQASAFRPNLTFGRSASLLGRSVLEGSGGFGSYYATGGARVVRLSLKLIF